MAEETGFYIIIKDENRDLYLRDMPLYRGQERWNCIREKAYKFETVEEAKEVIKSLRRVDIDVSYELEPKDKKHLKKLFDVEILFPSGRSTFVHWWGINDLDVTDRVFVLVRKANDDPESITVAVAGKQ